MKVRVPEVRFISGLAFSCAPAYCLCPFVPGSRVRSAAFRVRLLGARRVFDGLVALVVQVLLGRLACAFPHVEFLTCVHLGLFMLCPWPPTCGRPCRRAPTARRGGPAPRPVSRRCSGARSACCRASSVGPWGCRDGRCLHVAPCMACHSRDYLNSSL